MPRDWVKFPELRNEEFGLYYFESPHKQITEDFRAKVIKVTDGDTIRVETDFRDFDFPIRFMDTDARELNTQEGRRSKKWLENQILNKDVEIQIDEKRVDKWGRLLGTIIFQGMNMNDLSKITGNAIDFDNRTLLFGSKRFK